MPKRFENKVAVVTGGGSGMGRAIAVGFATEGATVAVLDVNDEGARETVSVIEALGGQAAAFKVDLRSSASIRDTAQNVLNTLGKVDVLVNNAGVFDHHVDLLASEEDHWDMILGVNLKAIYLMTQALMPALKASGAGAVVNTASVAGIVGHAGGVAYTVAKHGVIGFTKSVAADYGPEVRCNAVLPGAVMTAMTREDFKEGGKTREALMSTPAGRYAEPEEVARVVLFLASAEASFMYGAQVVVDGGWTVV